MNDNKGSGAGIGFTGLLTITFIVLKLTHVINWSWVWVLSPVWISSIVAVLLVVTIILIKIFKGE